MKSTSTEIEDDFGLKEDLLENIETNDLSDLDDEDDLMKLSANDHEDKLTELEADLVGTDQRLSDPIPDNEIKDVAVELDNLIDENSDDALLEVDNVTSEVSDSLSDLENTDFDALLNELAEPDNLPDVDHQEFEIDFDSLLSEENMLEEAIETNDSLDDDLESDFVEINDLIEQSDDEELTDEPYDNANMDVGLSDFDELLAGEESLDVDAQSGGYSAKLDLALAYLEIEDFESASKAVQDVIDNGPAEVQKEAEQLKQKIIQKN
jgi:pilus assembly protein FimV